MRKQPDFDPELPYDALPPVPPQSHVTETPAVLKLEAQARAAIAELKGFANIIPNQAILANAVVLREAKDSSEIENIVTTQDQLYRAVASGTGKTLDPAAKEVLRYREALWRGFNKVKERSILTIPDIVEIQRIIVHNDAGIRKTPGTALVNGKTGQVVYTPPQDPERIRDLLSNLAEYLNDDENSLAKSAVIHHQFESIHPFHDGNGRTGRIINVLYLILRGHLDIPILYLSSYIIEKKGEYYQHLQDVTRNGAWEEWILFILQAIESTARRTIETVRQIRGQLDSTVEYVKRNAPKVYSRELIETLFENPYCKNEFVERAVGVERKAASRYLHALQDIGVLAMRKIGRENIFINTELMRLLQEHP